MGNPGYAGDITAQQAWDLLAENPEAVLVDVRTEAEWRYVGVPDTVLDRSADAADRVGEFSHRRAQRQLRRPAPRGRPGRRLAGAASRLDGRSAGSASGVTPGDRPVVFLCRSGNRSIGAAEGRDRGGIAPSYNVLDGFEGPSTSRAPRRHRLAGRTACPGSSHDRPSGAVSQPAELPDGVEPGHHRRARRAAAVRLRGDRRGDVPDVRATSTRPRPRRRRRSPARSTATCTRATATRPSRCSRSGCA